MSKLPLNPSTSDNEIKLEKLIDQIEEDSIDAADIQYEKMMDVLSLLKSGINNEHLKQKAIIVMFRQLIPDIDCEKYIDIGIEFDKLRKDTI